MIGLAGIVQPPMPPRSSWLAVYQLCGLTSPGGSSTCALFRRSCASRAYVAAATSPTPSIRKQRGQRLPRPLATNFLSTTQMGITGRISRTLGTGGPTTGGFPICTLRTRQSWCDRSIPESAMPVSGIQEVMPLASTTVVMRAHTTALRTATVVHMVTADPMATVEASPHQSDGGVAGYAEDG